MSDVGWMAALFAVIVYCVLQAVRDFRAKRYAWAAAGGGRCGGSCVDALPDAFRHR